VICYGLCGVHIDTFTEHCAPLSIFVGGGVYIPLWPKSSFMTTLGFNPRYAVQGIWDFSINDAVGMNLYRFVTNVYRLATFLVQKYLDVDDGGYFGM
jgi:hypothetical protein